MKTTLLSLLSPSGKAAVLLDLVKIRPLWKILFACCQEKVQTETRNRQKRSVLSDFGVLELL